MEKHSIYSETYVKHPEAKRELAKAKQEYNPSTSVMDLPSTYNTDFTEKQGKLRKSYKPVQKYSGASKSRSFVKETNYSATFKKHETATLAWCRATPIKHQEGMIRTVENFSGSSTMQEDFKEHKNTTRAKLIKLNPETTINKDPFNGDTTYKQEFTSKQIQPTLPKKEHTHKKNDAHFMGESTMRTAYQPIANYKPEQSCKPCQPYNPCNVQFEDGTTASRAYKSWPVRRPEKPVWAKKQDYELPTQQFEVSSSYQDTFKTPADVERIVACAPKREGVSLGQSAASCMTKTQYQSEFVSYDDNNRAKSFKKIATYEAPKESMLFQSVYQSCYKGDATERAKPCIPVTQSEVPSDMTPLKYNTTYQLTFKGSKVNNCPVADIKIPRAGSAVSAKTSTLKMAGMKNGHQYFLQRARSASIRP